MQFTSINAFIHWLQVKGTPPLPDLIVQLDAEQLARYTGIFEKYGERITSFDMMQLTTRLGQAVAAFVLVARDSDAIDSETLTKPFVIESTVALYRLMADGNAAAAAPPAMSNEQLDTMFPGGIEQALIRPLAENAVAESLRIIKKMREI